MQQKMANLPDRRLAENQPPFYNTGLDYFGPVLVRQGRSEIKRWVRVFTCLSTRVCHLELASTLESDAFINVLTRFLSRRGQIFSITCDNGTNFIGAKKILSDATANWNKHQVSDYLKQRGIIFHLNPPSGSHFGGIFERIVGVAKKMMVAVVNSHKLNDDSLNTLLCVIENILNSRPLTTVSSDIEDSVPLTPNHLIRLNVTKQLPPDLYDSKDLFSQKRYKQIQYLANLFWDKWRKAYLLLIQLRPKWTKEHQNLTVNSVVLLAEDNLPRNEWLLGKVIEVHKSSQDGLVSSVKVLTRIGECIRPIHKLCLLEMATETIPAAAEH